MAKGNGEIMSDEEKEIDIESDDVSWLLHRDGFGTDASIVTFRICLMFFSRRERKMARKRSSCRRYTPMFWCQIARANHPHGLRLKTRVYVLKSSIFSGSIVKWYFLTVEIQKNAFFVLVVDLKGFSPVPASRFYGTLPKLDFWFEYFMRNAFPNRSAKWILLAGLVFTVTTFCFALF